MTELAIFAISSAGVTITVAICIFVLGRRAADAERRAGDAGAKASNLDGRLLAAVTSAASWKVAAGDKDARIIKLTDLIARMAKELPADGARSRLHAEWFALETASPAPTRTKTGELVRSADSGPPNAGTDLEKPGE